MTAVQVGDSFPLLDGSVVTVVGIRSVPRYIAGETQTAAGLEPVRIRMDDATVFDCELDSVRFTNSAAEMAALGGAA